MRCSQRSSAWSSPCCSSGSISAGWTGCTSRSSGDSSRRRSRGKSTPTWPTSAFWSRSYTSRCGSTSRGSPTAPRGLRERFYTALTLGRDDTSEASQAFDRRWLKRAGILGIPLAIFTVHGGTGVLFAVSKARPYWNSGLFPVIFVISALLSGTALVMMIYVLRTKLFDGESVDPALLDRLAQLLIGFIIIDAALTAIEAFIPLASLHPHEIETWQVIMYGPMSWSFWWFMVGLSWVFPMVLLSKKSWRRARR